jgi:alanyl-tRNA synthetase
VDRSDGGRRIYLDRTAFYPTSGGQPFDTGHLDGASVVDVVEEGERIAHLLSTPLEADRVRGRIDWPRRFDHMQQHSGQHLLSATLGDLFGFATTSVHFGAEVSTLDLDTGSITPEQVVEAELQANRIAAENRPVEVSFERADTAAGLRKVSEREGILRVVTIRDLDRSACGGTHVRATGEIGAVIIRGVERVRQVVRLEFCCGERAIRRTRREHDLLSRAAGVISTTPEELPALLEGQRRQLKEASAATRLLEQELAAHRARELYQAAVPDPSGTRRIVVSGGEPVERLRPLAQAVAELPQAVFVGTSLQPPAVLLSAAEDSGLDAGLTLQEVLQRFGGRGGGNSRLAQGTVGDAAVLEAVVADLSSRA